MPLARLNEATSGVPVVLVHGFKGAYLGEPGPNGRVHWVTMAQALTPLPPSVSGQRTLVLPMTYNADGQQDGDGLVPLGLIGELGAFPVAIQMYAPVLKLLKGLDRPAYAYAYDWRRCNLENAAALEKALEELQSEWKCAPQVIGHSMGGMLTCHIVNRRPELFHSILFAGVPFQLNSAYMYDVNNGNFTGVNPFLITAEALFSFSSGFCFFPLDGVGIKDKDGKPIVLDYFDAQTWIDHRIGIFNDITSIEEFGPDHVRHLRTVLPRAKLFKEGLLPVPGVKYPPIAALCGVGHQCLVDVIKDGPRALRGYDFDSMPKADGDGRIASFNAVPLEGMPYKLYTTKQSHSVILNDPVLVSNIINDLMQEHTLRATQRGDDKPLPIDHKFAHPMPRLSSVILPAEPDPMQIL